MYWFFYISPPSFGEVSHWALYLIYWIFFFLESFEFGFSSVILPLYWISFSHFTMSSLFSCLCSLEIHLGICSYHVSSFWTLFIIILLNFWYRILSKSLSLSFTYSGILEATYCLDLCYSCFALGFENRKLIFFWFFERISLCSSGWPGIWYVD